jgi:epoxyqueuosine reductase
MPLPDTEAVRRLGQAEGFALVGVCDAIPRGGEGLRAWLAAGRNGTMSYMDRNVEARIDPRILVPGAKSIICVADRYPGMKPEDECEGGLIARYARGDDYHRVIKRRLHAMCDAMRADAPEFVYRACVDTAPIMERQHAAAAGLGAIGRNTLLISPSIGSWMLLGAIVTTLPLQATKPIDDDPCGSCTRCIDACPTGAISDGSVNARLCISYLTIEHRGDIDLSVQDSMGRWVFGCDVCQEVCPHNAPTERTIASHTNPAYDGRDASLDVREVMDWTEDDRLAAFRGSAMKRAKLDMIRRNAAIVAANNGV